MHYTLLIIEILLFVSLFESSMAKKKKTKSKKEKEKAKPDFFTSASDMEVLLTAERKLAKKFLRYAEKEEERLDRLDKMLSNIEEKRPISGTETRWLSHATNSYKILHSMTSFWPNIGSLSKENTTKDDMIQLFADLNRVKYAFPTEDDMKGALAAVLRLQDTFDISAEEFTEGLGTAHAHKLSVEEIFEIGFLCIGLNDHFHAEQWLRQTLKRFPEGMSQVGFLDRISLLEYLAWSEYHLGNLEAAIELTEQIVHIVPNHRAAPTNLELYKQDLEKSKTDPKARKTVFRREKDWANRHNMLCQGLEKMEQKIIDKLYCEYGTYRSRFILKPLKIEHVYNDPKILIYHDLLRDWEMERVKEKARPMLRRATVYDPKSGNLVYANYRISKSAWIEPEMDEIAHQIINKVGDVTGLNMHHSESLQVANYGLAGQYEPHFDHSTIKSPKEFKTYGGNRIATVLMYMTNVERGGSTIFVNTGPGVAVQPEKGAGVFWYNLKRNGESNPKTRHAACPVLIGQKWVSNLWIHEHGQEFRRPCSLNPDE